MGRDRSLQRVLVQEARLGGGTHLCGTDDGLPSSVAPTNHHLLGKEDLLCRDLNAQITTRHHDPITGFQDFVKPDRQVAETEVIQNRGLEYGDTVSRDSLTWSFLQPGQVSMTSSQRCSSCLSLPKGANSSARWALQHQDGHFTEGKGRCLGLSQNPMGSLLFSLNLLFYVEVQLINHVLIVSDAQQRLSRTHTCIHSPLDSPPTQAAI